MKIDLQIERIISEIKRGQKVVVYDSISQISVLLSAAELVHNTTLNEHISMGLSFPNIILSSQRCNSLGIKTNKNCSFFNFQMNKETLIEKLLVKLTLPTSEENLPTIFFVTG